MENTESFNKHRLTEKNKQEVTNVAVAKEILCDEKAIADQIIFGTDKYGHPNEYLTEREKQIMLTTLQWLGSSVGQSYLQQCGLLKEFKY